jgi:hypothetical protein
LKFIITINSDSPELLDGLDAWLYLGLLDDAQVRQLCQSRLVCDLPPQAATAPTPEVPKLPPVSAAAENPPVEAPQPSRLSQMWQSLKDELSVRWLLFLGVFLVVVSSGVLAATQWENFPAVGQYGVLWGYTVLFWGIGAWAGRQQNLQLTSQTLQLIALLLVPVNFWAMDSFDLWQQSWQWFAVAIAAVTLSIITLRHHTIIRASALLVLGLSFLHWGWHVSDFPLIAVYVGMVATAIFLPIRYREDTTNQVPTGSAIVIYALAILLGRALFVQGLPVEQLGLAIGTCGWLLGRLGQARDTEASLQSPIWQGVGGGLLLLGWLVSFEETPPWQATVVSGLGLWFFGSRLRQAQRQLDFLAIFIIGLQAHWLIWRLIPIEVRQETVTLFAQLVNAQDAPWALLSVALFPYLIGLVAIADGLRRTAPTQLQRFAEGLILPYGVALTLISLVNPLLRSLVLLLSTLTLATITYRWTPTRKALVFLTHISGLLTLNFGIDWLFPDLSQPVWAGIFLLMAIAEWGFSVLHPRRFPWPTIWQRTAWLFGFVLSGLSYVLLVDEINEPTASAEWGLLWLLTPLALTGVARLTRFPRRQQAAGWSIVALGMAQVLTAMQPGVRLISLSVAVGLMLLNTGYLRQQVAAIITLGFALSFFGVLLWEVFPELSVPDWFLAGAIATFTLWLLRRFLQMYSGTLIALYVRAADSWGVLLCGIELALLTIHATLGYLGFIPPHWEYLAASGLIGGAIAYRSWQSFPNPAVFGMAWAVELLAAEGVLLAEGSLLDFATVTIALGLIALFLTEWWLSRQSPASRSRSLEILPLLYALLGLGLRVPDFTPYTGWLILGAALTGIGVGRRRRQWKPVTYISLAGISLAWYELVLYQMSQAPEGSIADAFIVWAGVATVIAFAYRLLGWFWQLRRAEAFLSLSTREIEITAHIHWGIGSLLIIAATGLAIDMTLSLANVGILVGLLLTAYALVQGRDSEENELREWKQPSHLWVYGGWLQGVVTVVYARIIWTELSLLDPWFAAIASILAGGLYPLPWQRWGWQQTPWQRAVMVLPVLVVLLTAEVVSNPSLLLVALVYLWLAHRRRAVRLTYLSVALADWAIADWFMELELTDPLWYAAIVGLSLLYVAQVDPELQQPQMREARHNLRLSGMATICLVAFLFHQETGLIPGVVSIAAIFAGLTLRVRAYLFVGTATFILTAGYQLVILIFQYSFVKWVISLVVGILFIGIAANFETRREQIASVVQDSRAKLEAWE